MGECRGSIDVVKRMEGELTEDEDDTPGLTNPTSTDTQSAGQLHTHTHSHITSTANRQITSSCKYSVSCINQNYEPFSSRCDRALGADPGSVPERETQTQTEPPAVAAADLRSADHEGLAGSV